MQSPVRIAATLTLALAGLIFATATAAEPTEGIDYVALDEPVTDGGGERVEVLELFWYGCPHCRSLEEPLQAWLEEKGDAVRFERIPAPFNEEWVRHARAYYAAELHGVADEAHDAFFRRFHDEGDHLHGRGDLAAFYGEFGVDPDEFRGTMDGFGVNTKMRRAKRIAGESGADSVPTIIIDGRYRTSPSRAGSQEAMLEVMDYLIEKSRP
ncbi:MAG: thiol:disulfide interchange protein DsbA/DsbL [Pseudomonadota bacterium]